MTQIFRVVTTWSGFNGAPGYTNHFFRNVLPGGVPTGVDDEISAIAGAERVHNFWAEIMNLFPNDVTLTVENVVDVLEDTNGQLQASIVVPSQVNLQGAQPGPYSASTGAVIGFQTGEIRKGRRIRGRTFLVPLSSVAFGNSGRIDAPNVAQIQAAASDLVSGGFNSTFGIWARPSTKGATDGVWAQATGARTSDLPAVLRSRRD